MVARFKVLTTCFNRPSTPLGQGACDTLHGAKLMILTRTYQP